MAIERAPCHARAVLLNSRWFIDKKTRAPQVQVLDEYVEQAESLQELATTRLATAFGETCKTVSLRVTSPLPERRLELRVRAAVTIVTLTL